MNTLTLVGNLTADPELKVVGNGNTVVNFTVAHTPRVYDKASNEWKDGEPLFMRCSLWREHAENVANSLHRGSRVIVVGKVKQRGYEKDGEKRTTVELEVDEIGPTLRYATATPVKASRGAARPAPAADAWSPSTASEAPF